MNEKTETNEIKQPTEPPTIKLKTAQVWKLIGRRNMSQNELARRAGISSGYLSRLLAGRKCPSPAVRRRLQAALEVSEFEELFTMEYGNEQ